MHTHSSEYHVCRILVDFIESGALKIVRARGLGPSAPPPPSRARTRSRPRELFSNRHRPFSRRETWAARCATYRAAKSLDPDNHVVLQAIEDGEETIRVQLLEEGIEARAVPKISTEIGDLSQMDLSPDEGFLLSRINGSMDIQTILQITPMPGLESMVALLRLKNAPATFRRASRRSPRDRHTRPSGLVDQPHQDIRGRDMWGCARIAKRNSHWAASPA